MRRLSVTLLMAALGCAEAPESPSGPPLTADQEAAQSRFLTDSGREAAEAYRSAFAGITTVDDFSDVLDQALALQARLVPDDSLDEYGQFAYRFQAADLGLPGIEPSCVAECTVVAMQLHREDIEAAAAGTESSEDDAFAGLLFDFWGFAVVVDGEVGQWPSFFERTWDYGGYSLLGNGEHLSLLRRIISMEATGFRPEEVARMRQVLIGDIIGYPCFGPEADAVVGELESILALEALTEGERTSLERRLSEVGTGSGVEVGCAADLSCSCASG